MFRSRSRAELSAWIQRRRYFRFYRALGGQANDSDSLAVSIKHDGDADTRDASVFVWHSEHATENTLSRADGNYYEITEADAANAVPLEARIAHVGEQLIDSPVGGEHWGHAHKRRTA